MRHARVRPRAQAGRAPAGPRHGGAGAARRRGDRRARRPSLATCPQQTLAAAQQGAGKGWPERLFGAAYRGRPGRRTRRRLRARCRRQRRAGDGGARRARPGLPARGRRDRHRPRRLVVYLGTHGDRGAHRADVILPGRGLSREIRHLCQYRGAGADGRPRSFPPGEAREDWADPAGAVGCARPEASYDSSLPQLRQALFKVHPNLQRIGQIAPGDSAGHRRARRAPRQRGEGRVRFRDRRFLFHQPDRRASVIMAECSAIAEGYGALTAAE